MSPIVVEDSKLFNWTGNEIKYAGWWILIGIVAFLITIPFILLSLPLGQSLDNFSENTVILIFYVLSATTNIPF